MLIQELFSHKINFHLAPQRRPDNQFLVLSQAGVLKNLLGHVAGDWFSLLSGHHAAISCANGVEFTSFPLASGPQGLLEKDDEDLRGL